MRKGLLTLIMILVSLFFIIAIGKILHTQYIDGDEWRKLAEGRQPKAKELIGRRGNIYSADGQLLATSMPYYKLHMDMTTQYLNINGGENFYKNVDSLAIELSHFFGDKTVGEYKTLLRNGFAQQKKDVLLSKNTVSYMELKTIKKFHIFRGSRYSGLITKEVNRRINPYYPLGARTIGSMYADITRGGQSGVEYSFDAVLRGEKGYKLPSGMTVKKPEQGLDVVLTLDMEMQEAAALALEQGMMDAGATKGCAILMDVETGEIKANVNLTRKGDKYVEENLIGLTENMPPGSTFKTVSMLVALEDGTISPNDSVDTGQGAIMLYNHKIKDSHAVGKVSAEEVIATSSNVGTALLIDRAYHKRPEYYVDLIRKTGFSQPLDSTIGLLGCGKPDLRSPKDKNDKRYWSQSSLAVMSFGYETTVPPIYMLRFYNAIANQGKMVNPKFVKELKKNGKVVKEFDTEVVNPSICSKKTIEQITKMLTMVVEDKHGTGYGLVRSKVLSIAGKTGTATDQRVGHVGNYASFCGFFPVKKPRYTLYVMMYGGRIFGNQSGKVFRLIAENVSACEGGISLSAVTDTLHLHTPNVKAGNYYSTRKTLNSLNVDFNHDSISSNDRWQIATNDSTGLTLYSHDWQPDLVPNVIGMGAKDAITVLEQSGYKVILLGYGKVISQSINPGTKCTRGATITLTLKNKS